MEGALRACEDKAQELAESKQQLENNIESLLEEKVNMECRIESISDTAKHIISAMQLEGTLGFNISCLTQQRAMSDSLEEDGQVQALETDHEERSTFESCIDYDLDAINCALKIVNVLWDKYSAKVRSSFETSELICFT